MFLAPFAHAAAERREYGGCVQVAAAGGRVGAECGAECLEKVGWGESASFECFQVFSLDVRGGGKLGWGHRLRFAGLPDRLAESCQFLIWALSVVGGHILASEQIAAMVILSPFVILSIVPSVMLLGPAQ